MTPLMHPGLRRAVLLAHVTTSVGWFGAVATFLVLAIAGLKSADPMVVRSAYSAMNLTGWFIIVPLCFASLPTGLWMSLGTPWGLFRHYWVVAKLAIAVVATVLLIVHMQPVGHMASAVAQVTLREGELAGLRMQLVADAIAACVALLIATALSIYKPWGMTAYGIRTANRAPAPDAGRQGMPVSLKIALLAATALGALIVIHHLMGRSGH